MARVFLERFYKSMDKAVRSIAPDAMRLLEAYDWPGNVRELENTIERAVALESGHEISANVLPEKIFRAAQASALSAAASNGASLIPEGGIDLEQHLQAIEKGYLIEALRKSDGVGTHAADLLKVSYRSFRHYSKKYNL
jgi:two-component system response regulator PilR (NtrC family)